MFCYLDDVRISKSQTIIRVQISLEDEEKDEVGREELLLQLKKKKKLLPFSDQEAICSDFAYPRAAGFLPGQEKDWGWGITMATCPAKWARIV